MQAILEAGVRVIARGGMRGLTHRAVDAEAGIPEGSTSGYYRTRMALVVAISEWVCRRLGERVVALGDQVREGHELKHVGDTAVEMILRWIDDEELIIAQMELTTEATRHPQIDEVLKPYRRAAVELVREIMTHIGVADPDTYARASLSAMTGVIFVAATQAPEHREQFVRSVAPIVISGFGTFQTGQAG